LGLANGDQTGSTFDSLQTIRSKISETIIAAGTPSATPGASTVSTVATFAPTSTTLAAGGTTYANINSGSATFTNNGINNFIRTGSTAAQVPAVLVRYQRTDQTGAQDNDGVDFRLSVGGTSTSANIARFDAVYKSSGDNEIGMSVSTDSFSADTDRIYVGSRASTKIRATPSGGGTASDIMEITDAKILNNRATRNAITTATVTEGGTYTPAATDNNSISLTINTGSGTTIIDLIDLTGQGTGGMYTIMVFNNTATGTPIQVRNTRISAGNLTTHTIPSGERIMVTAYIVGDYATSEHLVVA
jgi:hypothetical protein